MPHRRPTVLISASSLGWDATFRMESVKSLGSNCFPYPKHHAVDATLKQHEALVCRLSRGRRCAASSRAARGRDTPLAAASTALLSKSPLDI